MWLRSYLLEFLSPHSTEGFISFQLPWQRVFVLSIKYLIYVWHSSNYFWGINSFNSQYNSNWNRNATHSTILVWKIPWTGNPAGYSPWRGRESDDWSPTHTTLMVEKYFSPISQMRRWIVYTMNKWQRYNINLSSLLPGCSGSLQKLDDWSQGRKWWD